MNGLFPQTTFFPKVVDCSKKSVSVRAHRSGGVGLAELDET